MRLIMSSFHQKYDLINLYEIVGEAGEVEWAGGSAHEAIKLLRSSANKRLLVSGWDSNEEDARLVGQPIDVTQVALAAIVWER
jgi:hypothetical protein